MDYKFKKIMLSLFFSTLTILFTSQLTKAEPYDTGNIAATRAAEQKAALAKKAEKRKKAAEAKNAAGIQQVQPAGTGQPASPENNQEKSVTQ